MYIFLTNLFVSLRNPILAAHIYIDWTKFWVHGDTSSSAREKWMHFESQNRIKLIVLQSDEFNFVVTILEKR
jgi:hypothetical protein